MAHVKPVPQMVWTRKSAAVSLLLAVEEHQRQMGARLAALRDGRGLTQEELAHEARVSTKTVSRLENGRHEAELGTIRKLSEALGVDESAIRGTPPAPLGLGAETQLDRIEQDVKELAERLDQLAAVVEKDLADRAAQHAHKARRQARGKRSAAGRPDPA